MNFQSCFAFLGWTNSPKISGSFRMIGERWDNFVTIALPCLNMFHFDNWTSIAGFLLRSYVSKPRFLWLRPMISMTPKRINWQVTKRSGKSTKYLLHDPLEVLNTLNTSSHSIHRYPYPPQQKVKYYNPSHFGHRCKRKLWSGNVFCWASAKTGRQYNHHEEDTPLHQPLPEIGEPYCSGHFWR